jgi:hypothetical protein
MRSPLLGSKTPYPEAVMAFAFPMGVFLPNASNHQTLTKTSRFLNQRKTPPTAPASTRGQKSRQFLVRQAATAK